MGGGEGRGGEKREGRREKREERREKKREERRENAASSLSSLDDWTKEGARCEHTALLRALCSLASVAATTHSRGVKHTTCTLANLAAFCPRWGSAYRLH